MKKLHISKALALPRDVVTSTLVVYGGKGMGKTNFGSVLAEELAAAGLRFSIIDPMGVWWGLRHSINGKGLGIEVLILGGIHGDIPIEPTGGAVVADLVVDEDANVLIDISRRPDGTMWSIAERVRFVTDYCKRLYQRQGERRRPILQFIDEAARFIPQVIRKGEEQVAVCMGAIAVLVEEGRNVAIGVMLLTQRSARLNKDVAELADCMIAFRTVGPNSRRAVLDWLGEHVEKERLKDLDAQVRALPRGSALVVSPGWLEYEGVAAMRARTTFDSSATPKAGEERKASGPGAKPDLEKYQARMAATIEKAKAEDPKELKKRVAELEKQLRAKAPAAAKPVAAPKVDPAELRQARADVGQLQAHNERLTQALERLMKFILEINAQDFFKAGGEAIDQAALQKVIDAAAQQALKLVEVNVRAQGKALESWRRQGEQLLAGIERLLKREVKVAVNVRHNQPFTVTPAPQTSAKRPPAVSSEGPAPSSDLSRPQQALLDALAYLESVGIYPSSRRQMALVAQVSAASSGFEKNVSTLRTAGLIAYPSGGTVALTDGGKALARPPESAPTVEGLQEAIYGRLSKPQAALLKALVQAYPEGLSREDLGTAAAQSPLSSGFEKNVSTLRSVGLVDYPDKGHVRALPVLFLEGQ